MASLSEITFLIRFSGVSHVARILRYSNYRNRLDKIPRQEQAARLAAPLKAPGKLIETQPFPGGIRLKFENSELVSEMIAPSMARLSWTPGASPPPYAVSAQFNRPLETAEYEQQAEGYRLSAPGLVLLISSDGCVQFLSPAGELLRQDYPPQHQGEPQPPAWISQATLRPEECIFGLGEQTLGPNLRGSAHQVWNSDPGGSYGPGKDPIYMPLPVYMGIHQQGSYLLFYDNSYDARFDFRPQEPRNQNNSKPDCQVRFEGGMLRYYFIAGSPRQILERFTELTGRTELPPRWSLGYHQSRWGYRSEADIREVVQGFKAREMPLSAIHLDIDYMDGYRVFTVDKNRFPDLSALADDLLAQGIRLVPIIDPGVKIDPQYHVYQEGLKAGLYVRQPDGEPLKGVVWPGWCVFPDFTRPEARRWWGAYYPALLDSGMAGIWHDMNEPAAFTTGAGLTISLAGKHSIEGAEGDHLQAHNLYGLLMNRSAHQAMKKHKPERRPWILSRSGWVSQQRFAWNWMGDSESTWASLRMTITQTLGLGLSGQPYTGPDIGGFSGSPDAELYLRWFQAAAFLPFFRTHAAIGTARREPWIYGEPTTSVIRTYLRLRYQLMPYLYTLAWQASQSGTPLIRPLFWLENDCPEFWKAVQQETGDAFLLGDSLLVAPIFEPGASSRTVHLPTGCWYDFWNDTFYTGGQTVQVAVTLENIPVFVRGGSLLPLDSEGQLNLNLFAPGLDPQTPFTSLLYSDAGDGYGDFRIDRFNLTRNKEYLELDWLSEGVYPFPYNDVQIHLHGFAARSAWIDRQFVQIQDQVLHTQSFSKARFEG